MNEDRSALAHDVGKYVARTARNVPPGGAMPPALIPMLIRDLYELPGGKRASARFDELALHGEPAVARAALREIDALEADVRAGDDAACRRACVLALEVERVLRRNAAEAGP